MALFGLLDQSNDKNGPGYADMAGTNDEELDVSFVDKEFKRRQEERRPYEIQWRLNTAFLEGNQYVDINPTAMNIEEIPKMYWWQEREVFNHIAPIVETRIAKLQRMRPILKVRPATGEQSDLKSAKVSSSLLQNIYSDEGVKEVSEELFAWNEACGNVFLKHVWNPQKGDVIMQYVDGETGEITKQVKEGDVDMIMVPPQEIYPDNVTESNILKQKSLIHAKAYKISEIKEIWGADVQEEDTSIIQISKMLSGVGGLGYGQGGFNFNVSSLKGYAIVKEYHELPTKQYPKGRLIMVCGGKRLYKGDMPYTVGEDGQLGHPFVKLSCIKRSGCFWDKAIVERAIPVQRRYNALRNRISEYLNRCAISNWMIEDGSVDLDTFEEDAGSPGAITIYQKGFTPPYQVQSPPLPAEFTQEKADLMEEFSMLSGVSEFARMSSAPPGVKSGVALGIANEQDDTRLSSTAGSFENFLIAAAKQWLRLYKQFASNQRILRNINKNNIADISYWQASDLGSEDVIIDSFSALAESPAQRRQMVFDFLNTPLFLNEQGQIDQEMKSRIFQMIEMGDWEDGDSDQELHLSKADRENKAMGEGTIPQVVNYDDHVLHIKRHNNYRLSVDYEELKAQNVMVEQVFEAHLNQHLQMMQAATQAQGQQEKPPSTSISFKDLPPDGQIQLAQQAGIEIQPPATPVVAQQPLPTQTPVLPVIPTQGQPTQATSAQPTEQIQGIQ